MEKRKLGKTPEHLSVIGFGGILVMDETPSESSRLVATAVQERGINYFDVAPSYGNAEDRLGPALEPYRKSVFLACKTGKRDAKGSEAELHQSLKRMRTDHFDLYQLHAVTDMQEVDKILAPGGAIETFVKAREKGYVRYLGFSAHSEEAALALMERFPFDTVLFPVSWAVWYAGKFGPRVVAKAQEKGLGILALKALAKRKWGETEEHKWKKAWYSPVDNFEEASFSLRFTLSQPVTAAVSPGHAELLWWACDIADNFKPLTDAEKIEVEHLSEGIDAIFQVAA